MTFDADDIRAQIPYYLADADREALASELRSIVASGSGKYVLSAYEDTFHSEMLQGDGWRGFQVFSLGSGERMHVRGLVLTNSCDVDPGNKRDVPTRVSFAPLVKLSAYAAVLQESGIPHDQIESKLGAIRSQKTTSMFYLPAGGPLDEEYVVRFDEIQSMPISMHKASDYCQKLFTLSQAGFFMLILKLSIHFCRMHEGVNRAPISGLA